jgi:branched-chain amino acid transport system permease protein
MKPITDLRPGLITGTLLLFFVLIGIYTTFEALTLRGVWLTIQGATASEIAAQVPTSTNPQFSRVFTVFAALIAGAVAARGSKTLGEGLVRALITNALAGAVVAVFLIIVSALYANKFDVAFVFEKLKQQTVTALLFGQPALVGGAIWIGVMAAFGALGALLLRAWRALRIQNSITAATGRSGVNGNQIRIVLLALVALFLIIAPQFIGVYWNQVLGSIGLFVILGLGLNIVVGFAGLLDLGYVGFYAIGAYTIAVLTSPSNPYNWGFWPALPIAMITAAIAGTLLGIPVLRLRGDYLAIVTLGFGEIIRIIFKFLPGIPFNFVIPLPFSPEGITVNLGKGIVMGGPQGILNVAPPDIAIPFINYTIEFDSSTPFWYLIFAASIVVAFVAARLNNSRLGRSWTAMREDEDAAEAMGVDTTRIKLLAFGTGAFFAGLGGAVYASRQQHIFPDDFTLLVSINALALIIIGGLGSIPGVIIGSIVLIGLPEVLRPIADYRLLAYSALLVVMMLVRPEGLIPAARHQREFRERDADLEPIEPG